MSEIIYGGRMLVKEKDKKSDNLSGGSPISQWQIALSDARRKLSESQGLSRRLRIAIAAIESKIQNNEPWPGTTRN
jgi:hypothetical protein